MIKSSSVHAVNANGDQQQLHVEAVLHVALLIQRHWWQILAPHFYLFVLLVWNDGSKHTVNKANII